MHKYLIIKILLFFCMSIILIRLFYIQIIKNNYYINKKIDLTVKYISGETAPRGRIYDRNGKLLVDNKPNKVIYYNKNKKDSNIKEKDIVKLLSEYLEIDTKKLTSTMLKDYYLYINNPNLLTKDEKELYNDRKLSDKEIMDIKYSRITDEMLESINPEEAYIYFLMNNGYSYQNKIIKSDNVTDYEYAIIAENLDKLSGVNIKLDFKREYLYNDTFKSILGRIGPITKEIEEEYLKKGYDQNDIVGLSYLEYQYDDYLKGKKNEYIVDNKGNYSLVKKGERGNDLYLTIDIDFQKEVDDIIIRNIINSKYEYNTRYLDKSFVVVTNPKTGEILAMSSKQVINGNVYDYTPGIITTSYTIGSAVKGASHIVGYNTNALKIGEIRDDSCIKIKSTNEKCSVMYLGVLDDITALKYSSNTYQFRTAIKVGKGNYYYNAPLVLDEEAFNTYRNTFNMFGLGVKTEIDLPNEQIGYIGDAKNSNLLLNFAIGQYDTYTPIELSQYINSIATKNRIQPYLVSKILDNNKNEIYKKEPNILNTIDTKDEYINRVRLGFIEVLKPNGTGYNYINSIYKPAGKTGTSESFIDTNQDGKIDKETITTTFVAYAPYDNPIFSIIVITPNVSDHTVGNYKSMITKNIVRQVSDIYFQKYYK